MARITAHILNIFIFTMGALVPLLINVQTATANQDSLKLAWTYDTGNPVNIAPVLARDKVFIIPIDGPLFALNAKTGRLDWKYSPKAGLWARGLGADGNQLFVCYKDGKIAAVNVDDGGVKWKANLGINCQRPPLISGNTVYISTTFVGPGLPADPLTGATLFALNRDNGHIKWAFKSTDYLLQTATINNNTVYLGGNYIDPAFTSDEGGPAHYYALDAATGAIKWTYTSVDGTPKALYATRDQVLFIPYQDYVHALDPQTGELLWRRDTGNWVPSLMGEGNVIYFGSASTIVHAWSTNDGRSKWRFNIPGANFDYLLIKPRLTKDRLYFMSQRGHVYALDKETGKQIFTYATGMNARVSLNIKDNRLFMGDSKGRIYSYEILK